MTNKLSLVLFLLLVLFVSNTYAGYKWYEGSINRVWEQGGSFIVTFKSPSSLSGIGCSSNYAYFSGSKTNYDNMQSIALTGYVTGKTVGILLDVDAKDANNKCWANSIDLR